MGKCREEFERYQADVTGKDYEELKGHFDDCEKCYGTRYYIDSAYSEEWEVWQKAWQHQQAKADELQKRVDAAIKNIENFFDEQTQQPTQREYANFIADVLHELKAEQALRCEKKQNKYDWDLIPAHVKFMATDEDGMACGWLVEPHIVGNAWRNQSHLSAFFNLTKRQNPFRGDWRQSLEQRPDHVEQAPKEIIGAGHE